MILEQTKERVCVRFSPSEVAGCGLPAKGAYVTYLIKGGFLLETYSNWCTQSNRYEKSVDKLVALADKAVGWR